MRIQEGFDPSNSSLPPALESLTDKKPIPQTGSTDWWTCFNDYNCTRFPVFIKNSRSAGFYLHPEVKPPFTGPSSMYKCTATSSLRLVEVYWSARLFPFLVFNIQHTLRRIQVRGSSSLFIVHLCMKRIIPIQNTYYSYQHSTSIIHISGTSTVSYR